MLRPEWSYDMWTRHNNSDPIWIPSYDDYTTWSRTPYDSSMGFEWYYVDDDDVAYDEYDVYGYKPYIPEDDDARNV